MPALRFMIEALCIFLEVRRKSSPGDPQQAEALGADAVRRRTEGAGMVC